MGNHHETENSIDYGTIDDESRLSAYMRPRVGWNREISLKVPSFQTRLVVVLTRAGSAVTLGTVGPTAAAKWSRIMRTVGMCEVVDANGEVQRERYGDV